MLDSTFSGRQKSSVVVEYTATRAEPRPTIDFRKQATSTKRRTIAQHNESSFAITAIGEAWYVYYYIETSSS